MLDFIILSDCSNIFIYEQSTIIAHNLVWNPKMAEDMLFDEIGHSCSYHFLEPNSFHLLHIIFGDNKDPYVTI